MIGVLLLTQLAQPVPRLGSCPLGYYSQAGYCVPAAAVQRDAVPKVGSRCPFGWYTEGGYCIRSR